MKIEQTLDIVLSPWEAQLAASAFLQGMPPHELRLHGVSGERIRDAVRRLAALPRRIATELVLEALVIGERR